MFHMKHFPLMQCFQQFDESFQVIFTVVFDFDLTLLAFLVQGNFRAEGFLQVVFYALHVSVLFPRSVLRKDLL